MFSGACYPERALAYIDSARRGASESVGALSVSWLRWFGLRGPLDQGRWSEGCSKQIWDLSTGGTLNQGLPHNIFIYIYLNMHFSLHICIIFIYA